MPLNESTVEDAALGWFSDLGYAVGRGPDISPGGETLTPALSQRERGFWPGCDSLTTALSSGSGWRPVRVAFVCDWCGG
jgi:hypothetical protein